MAYISNIYVAATGAVLVLEGAILALQWALYRKMTSTRDIHLTVDVRQGKEGDPDDA